MLSGANTPSFAAQRLEMPLSMFVRLNHSQLPEHPPRIQDSRRNPAALVPPSTIGQNTASPSPLTRWTYSATSRIALDAGLPASPKERTIRQSSRLPHLLALALAATLSTTAFAAEPVTQKFNRPIADTFEKGLGAIHLHLADDHKSISLCNRALYEDDGPGLGADAKWINDDERSPTQELTGNTLFKKILVIDHPEALDGHFCIAEGLKVTVNGRPLSASPTRGDYPECPPALLKKGANEIVMEAPEGKTAWVKAATRKQILENAPDRAGNPPRSFKSNDDGKTWQPFDGEFFLRIELTQYVPTGSLISPSIDLAQPGGDGSVGGQNHTAILQAPIHVTRIALKPDQDTPEGTSITYFIRTGTSPAYDRPLWTAWEPAEAAGVKIPAGHRYLQWKAELATANATKTPLLKDLTVDATVAQDAPPPWAANLNVSTVNNADFRYTSIPFQYEDPNSPRMKNLREKYKLDQVVADGKTEFEKLVLLRNWVATYWKYKPPEGHYPEWDADEILTRKIGFCVQYAITYMECATALGYQTRFVMGNNYETGHEVTEVWSDDYAKWVFMDPNNNLFDLNTKTKAPMDLLEVRNLILKTYYDGKVANRSDIPKELKLSDDIAAVYRKQFQPETPIPDWRSKDQNGGKGDKFYVPPHRWMVLRWVDRNNYMTQPNPHPRTEGAGDWNYPDFWMWDDGRTLTQYRYRNLTARRADLEWTINETCFDAAYAAKPDTLAMQLCTVTPYFDAFMVNVDGKGWQKSDRTFDWTLHPGKNRVEMRAPQHLRRRRPHQLHGHRTQVMPQDDVTTKSRSTPRFTKKNIEVKT